MLRDPKNNNRLLIKKGAIAKLIRTHNQKFRIVVFTDSDGFLGKGAQGKCFLGILKNQQNQKPQSHDSDEQFDEQQIKKMLSSSSKYPIVVVKQILKDQKKLNQQDNYRKEIQNLSLVTQVDGNNSNLVKCYPYILTSEKHFYMVMEYCNGKSLDLLINRRLNSNRWFNFFEFLKIFTDIINGYYPLNKVMIMHEDLKPQNIFIKGKTFKIGDFGLSFLMKNEKGFSRGGTQSYNGIQKYQKNQVSHKSDMYSIGVILFKLFYGIHPYYEKRELEEFKANQIKILSAERNQSIQRIRITRWQQFEIFVKFYQQRELKQANPLIKRPQYKNEIYPMHEKNIEELYEEKIPKLLKKLLAKDFTQRPSFTDVYMFVKDNRVEEIVKEYEKGSYKKGKSQMYFFEDLQEKTEDEMSLSLKFSHLGNHVLFQNQSQVAKVNAEIPEDLLRTLSGNMQKKMILSKKYPRIFDLKQNLQHFNKLTRILMGVQQELSEFDLKSFIAILRRSLSSFQRDMSELSYKEPQNDNQILFYEDKKMEVQFVVQKYLLSMLNYVIKETQNLIKLFSEDELELFYKENVDLILQVAQKNQLLFQSQLFLAESDYSDPKKSLKDLQRIIVDQFLNNITLDKNNLLFVYYCLTILRIKDKIAQIKSKFTNLKPENLEKQNSHLLIQNVQTGEDILLEKDNITGILSNKLKEAPDAFIKEVEQIIIGLFHKRNIKYWLNID